MSNLKSCPFCGGEAELCYGPGAINGYRLFASCNECGTKSPGLWQEKKPEPDDQRWKDAADEWNSRPGEPDPENCGVAFCEHYSEGLPVCSKCREESTLAHDKACALLAEARARIDHLERIVDEMTEEQAALCAEDQSITELVAAKDKQLAEAQAEIENLKWHISSEKAKAEAALELNDRALELVNEARARIDILERAHNDLIEEQAAICAEGQSITELVAKKDKLIEQMREALQWYKEQVSSCNRNGDAGELARDRLAKDVGKRAEAALAAERGKE